MQQALLLLALITVVLWPLSGVLPIATANGQDAVGDSQPELDGRNLPPASDGIHDPSLEGTWRLQSPKDAFAGLPKANGGNYVNWTEALRSGKVTPRYEAESDGTPPVFVLDIVRGVKGHTPPAIFPHAVHAEWLGCTACHPAIFVPKKGANTMTMAEIMLGQKCGVCHGTVAFPAGECRRCHYQAEDKSPKMVALKQESQKKFKKRVRASR